MYKYNSQLAKMSEITAGTLPTAWMIATAGTKATAIKNASNSKDECKSGNANAMTAGYSREASISENIRTAGMTAAVGTQATVVKQAIAVPPATSNSRNERTTGPPAQ